MIQNKRDFMSVFEPGLSFLILLFLCVDIVIAEAEFGAEYELILPNNKLDLSLNLNKLNDEMTRPNFTGVWVLDHSVSDDPKKILKNIKKSKNGLLDGGKGFGKGPEGGKRRGKPEKDRHGGMGRSMAKSPPFGNEKVADQLEKLIINKLVIQHNEPSFRINMGKYGYKRIYTDLRGSSVSALGGVDQPVSFAGWEGNSLVIETTQNNAKKINEHFTLLTNPKRLERIIEILARDPENNTIQIKQVYELKNITIDHREDL